MPEQFYDVASYTSRDSVGYLVRRLAAIITNRLEAAFASRQFTLTQWSVLMHLRDGSARTASDLSCAFQHDSGALTRLLDQLEARGLIARRRSVRDRRVVELELTDAGERAIEALLPTVVAALNAALAPLSRAEFEQFRGALVKIFDHLAAGRTARPQAPESAPAPDRSPRVARAQSRKKTAARLGRKAARRSRS